LGASSVGSVHRRVAVEVRVRFIAKVILVNCSVALGLPLSLWWGQQLYVVEIAGGFFFILVNIIMFAVARAHRELKRSADAER